jgi:hypothetical protein
MSATVRSIGSSTMVRGGVRGDAERTADRPVIVGEEEQGIAADRSKPCHIGWWLAQNEAGDEVIFAEDLRIFEQLCQLLAGSGISGRAEKAEHHPASGADVQIEAAAGYERRIEPRHRIAQRDRPVACCLVHHHVSLRRP